MAFFLPDIVADYQRAFGEKSGLLTNTDNTGETMKVWYSDIRLSPREEPALATERIMTVSDAGTPWNVRTD